MTDVNEAAASGKVLLVVTGGIAAYKACEVLRGLQRAGCELRVVMTEGAERFVGPATFEALTRWPVADDLWTYPASDIPHIDLTDWADIVVVAPATGNIIAKMASGIADDCASATLLAAACPVVVAPAMNVRMWTNAATQANIETLEARGVRFVRPEEGLLACGDVGEGKLASVGEIVNAAFAVLEGAQKRDLAGTKIVITAGPTHEAIDPVRFIANASSGKTGYAIAEAACRRGAEVVLVSGPTALAAPTGVERVDVVSACEMRDAAVAVFADADAAICAAAVADYMPESAADQKLKKEDGPLDVIRLVQTPDILAELSAQKGERTVVGFAAETEDLIEHASSKLARKGCDLIVANDVSRADSAFGSDTRRVVYVSAKGADEQPTLPLDELADAILDRLAAIMEGKRG